MAPTKGETLVIGGGIIGLACAFFLHRQGRAVRVIHAVGLDESTSCGNAGGIAAAEVLPLSGPGVLLNTPKWLIDPLGPLSIRTAHIPRLLPWFWRFIGACTVEKRRYLAQAMATLLGTALADHEAVLDATRLSHLVAKKGALFVYKSRSGRHASQPDWDLRRDCGVQFEPLERAGLLEFEPALGPLAACGYRTEDWAHYRDPAELVVELAAYLKAAGVQFEQAEVDEMRCQEGNARGVKLTTGRIIDADHIVVAAGAWSARLSRQLGDPVSLESERGYNTTLAQPHIEVRSFVTFSEDYFVMTPMRMGLRIGGAVEFAGLQAPPNYNRARALLRLAKTYLPDLHTEGGSEWMGHRPSTPDSVPVISPAQHYSNVFYAFGHGHLGLTGSMTTGRLIADLVAGVPVDVDLSPFHIKRFS
ncbi:MAG: FAD-dependent oxidoreductase [Rhodospirillales bacterium]|nr:FAD-dependent oxidoreductase [Rhodospirillales bacterium]